jgi:hypothetical protein
MVVPVASVGVVQYFTDFSNSGVECLAFLSKQGEKMVSSEPSNLRKK